MNTVKYYKLRSLFWSDYPYLTSDVFKGVETPEGKERFDLIWVEGEDGTPFPFDPREVYEVPKSELEKEEGGDPDQKGYDLFLLGLLILFFSTSVYLFFLTQFFLSEGNHALGAISGILGSFNGFLTVACRVIRKAIQP